MRESEGNASNATAQNAARLMQAAKLGDWLGVRKLLDDGADPNSTVFGRTPLVWAVGNRHADTIKLLLDRQANLNMQDKGGNTALIAAVRDGWTPILGLFLSKGADPNIQDNSGDTALICAVGAGRSQAVKLLLEMGADPSIKNSRGETVLDLRCGNYTQGSC